MTDPVPPAAAATLVAAPVLLLVLATALTLAFAGLRRVQRAVAGTVLVAVVLDAAVLLSVVDRSGAVSVALGGHRPPAGIVLVADRLSALALLVSLVVALGVFGYVLAQRREPPGAEASAVSFHPSYLAVVTGMTLAYLTGDLFTLFVAFEIMLVGSYVLITRGLTRRRAAAGMTYVVVGVTSSLLFLTLVAATYAVTGTVNLADLAREVGALDPGTRAALSTFALAVFAVKAAAVPLHFWLPDSYPAAPTPISALFAGLLTKVAVYAMIRTQTQVFGRDTPWDLVVVVSMLTMVVGALGALAQREVHRLLSYLLVSHVGFLLFGLSLFTVRGGTGLVVYLAHHIVVQAALFLAVGLLVRRAGTASLSAMDGPARGAPLLAALVALPAASLAGIPPLSGFVAKLALLRGGAEVGSWLVHTAMGTLVLSTFLTLYAVARVVTAAVWGHRDGSPGTGAADDPGTGPAATRAPVRPGMVLATAFVVTAGLTMAVAAGPLAAFGERAAVDLLRPARSAAP